MFPTQVALPPSPSSLGAWRGQGCMCKRSRELGSPLLALVAFLYFSVIINLKNSESTSSLSDGVELGALDFSVFILAPQSFLEGSTACVSPAFSLLPQPPLVQALGRCSVCS